MYFESKELGIGRYSVGMTVGEGNREAEMLKTLKESGFRGSVGILCHIEDEDAAVVLKRNVEGLRKLEPGL